MEQEMAVSGRTQGFTASSRRHCERLLDDGLLNMKSLLGLLVGKRPTLSRDEKQSIIDAINAMENLQRRLSKSTTFNPS